MVLFDRIIDRKKNEMKQLSLTGLKQYQVHPLGDSKILFYINEGAIVEVLDEKNQLMEIILIDGKRGWVVSTALRKML